MSSMGLDKEVSEGMEGRKGIRGITKVRRSAEL